MPASRTSELAQAILGLCKNPQGRSTEELGNILDRNRNSVCSYVSLFVKDGELFRGGVVRSYRYFAAEEDAKAFTAMAEIKLAKQKEEAAKRKNVLAAKRQKQKYTAEKRREKYEKSKKNAPPRVDLAKRDSGLIIATKQQEIDHRRLHMQANVIWPENVKVTIIPTGVDTRFMAFVEPGKGQISRDQEKRWKLSART